jgi:hypothetical protein
MSSQKFPRANSLPGRALARLLNGERLTHRSFQNATSSYRLSHFIYVLHEYAWPVGSIEKVGKTNDPTGRKATYSEYFFNEQDIQKIKKELGSALDKFISAVDLFEQKGGGGEVV